MPYPIHPLEVREVGVRLRLAVPLGEALTGLGLGLGLGLVVFLCDLPSWMIDAWKIWPIIMNNNNLPFPYLPFPYLTLVHLHPAPAPASTYTFPLSLLLLRICCCHDYYLVSLASPTCPVSELKSCLGIVWILAIKDQDRAGRDMFHLFTHLALPP